MGQPPKQTTMDRAHRVYDIIADAPGVTAGEVARGLGTFPSVVKNSLITMERDGLYVSEAAGGRLYTFEYAGVVGV